MKDELTPFTFHYYSEDGNGHEITITAKNFLAAREIFLKTVGEDISFAVQ